jgi:hypothetical protein
MQDKDLQKAIDEIVQSEAGAEIILNAKTVIGALADFLYDPHQKAAVYQLVAPPDVMAYDNVHGFHVHDFLVQKGKDKARIVLRDTDGQIYIIKAAQSQSAVNDLNLYPLSSDDKEQLRLTLQTYLRSN